jgi:hypothetical protein
MKMYKRIFQFLIVLLGGPAMALGVIYIACRNAASSVNSMCGHNLVGGMFVLTLASWFVLAVAVSLFNGVIGRE